MRTDQRELSIVTNDAVKHYSLQEGFELFVLFDFDPAKKFEIFRQEIEPHAVHESTRHNASIREYCIAIKGLFTVEVDDVEYYLQEGEEL